MAEAMYSPSPTPTPTLTPYPSATPSPYPSRHTSGSPSPSPSSSFLGDRALLLSRKHTIPFVLVSGRPCCGHRLQNRSSSLDDVRSLRNFSTGCDGRHRRSASAKSSRRRKESVYSDGRRASRRPSTSIDRSRSGSARSRRISAVSTSTPITPYVQTTFDGNMIDEEYLKKHRRHRIAFWMFLGSFIFIAMSSILVVVITLTHQSEYNTTVTYYTFAKPSSMVIDGQQTRSQGE